MDKAQATLCVVIGAFLRDCEIAGSEDVQLMASHVPSYTAQYAISDQKLRKNARESTQNRMRTCTQSRKKVQKFELFCVLSVIA